MARGTPIRLEMSKADLALLKQAADYCNMTLRQFILQCVRERAERVMAGAYTGN